MIKWIWRSNPLILFIIRSAALFTLCVCIVIINNSILAQEEVDILSTHKEVATLTDHVADNCFEGDPATCSRCHEEAAMEILQTQTAHLKAGVNCITCHGQSVGHIQNEKNEEKPDRVITETTMNSFCVSCHDASASHDEETISQILCNNCHYAHDP